MPQHAHRERVDQRVRLIDAVEDRLAADVRKAEAVAVEADAAGHAVHDAGGVGVVDRPEAQGVHDRDRARAHRDDVADDAADAGGRALEGLDEGGVVVRLGLEGDGPALADVDDARVLAHAHHEAFLHLVGDLLAEPAQVVLARLVGAVLRPHHRVHRQLARGGAAAEDLLDARVLVVLEPEGAVRLLLLGRRDRVLDGVGDVLGGRCRGGGHAHSKGRGRRGRFSLPARVAAGSRAGAGAADGVRAPRCGRHQIVAHRSAAVRPRAPRVAACVCVLLFSSVS